MSNIAIVNRLGVVADLLLTTVVRDLRAVLPEERSIHITTSCPEVWADNPHVSAARPAPDDQVLAVPYGQASRSLATGGSYRKHALMWGVEYAAKDLDLDITCTDPKPDLYLSDDEFTNPPNGLSSGKYWLFSLDTKASDTSYQWPDERWQEIVNALIAKDVPTYAHKSHQEAFHSPKLAGVGENAQPLFIRDLMRLVKHSCGVVTYPGVVMHLAAAFEKECLVIGGPEPKAWNAYERNHHSFGDLASAITRPHNYIHPTDLLSCSRAEGCGAYSLESCQSVKNITLTDITSAQVAECQEKVKPSDLSLWILSKTPNEHRGGYIIKRPTVIDIPPAPGKRPTNPIRGLYTSDTDLQNEPMDHPLVGGKFTIFVLTYGPYPQLARRCLQSILDTVPAERLDLRIWANVVSKETRNYLEAIEKNCTKIYWQEDPEKAVKYPAMRQMFRDTECPIQTPYLIWFDDDSFVYHKEWYRYVASAIVRWHPFGHRMFGIKKMHTCKGKVIRHQPVTKIWPPRTDADIRESERVSQLSMSSNWFETRPWFKGVPYRDVREQHSPNGTKVYFAHGGWWALHVPTILEADIPDETLWHNGGDITIGEQINQAGYHTGDLNHGQGLVKVSNHNRRGTTSTLPWILHAKEKGLI